jgi:hypothetical protein
MEQEIVVNPDVAGDRFRCFAMLLYGEDDPQLPVARRWRRGKP